MNYVSKFFGSALLGLTAGFVYIFVVLIYLFVFIAFGRGNGSVSGVLLQENYDPLIKLMWLHHFGHLVFFYFPATLIAFYIVLPLGLLAQIGKIRQNNSDPSQFHSGTTHFFAMISGGVPFVGFTLAHYTAYYSGAEPLFLLEGTEITPAAVDIFAYLYVNLLHIDWIIPGLSSRIESLEVNNGNFIFSAYMFFIKILSPSYLISIVLYIFTSGRTQEIDADLDA